MKGFTAAQSRYDNMMPDDDECPVLHMDGEDYIIIKFALIKAETAIESRIEEGDTLGMAAADLIDVQAALNKLEDYE